MNRYEKVIQILDTAIGGPAVEIGSHGAFWRGITRDEFVSKRVRNLDLVIVGDGNGSNLIKALRGESPFGTNLPVPPPGARYPRMPAADLDPVPNVDIEFIRQWIDDGCPEDQIAPDSPMGISATTPTYRGEFRNLVWEPLDIQARAKLAALAPADQTQDPFLRAFLNSGMKPPTVPGATNADEEFAVLLMAAAEIEHALMVQYLYAWFTSQDDTFLTIAIQEMGHLFSMQNLLRCFGYKPHLQLPEPTIPSADDTYPFPLYLGSASLKTLAQYVIAESPLADTLKEPLRSLTKRAEQDAMINVRHVGILFLKLYWLTQPSKRPFGPWDPPLTEEWEAVLGMRHLTINTLATKNQRSWDTSWDIAMDSEDFLTGSAKKQIFVGKLNDNGLPHAEQVSRLFYAIGQQGEGFEIDMMLESHFERFIKIYETWKNADVVDTVPNPWIGSPSDDPEREASRITNPDAVVLAHAFNLRYERILLLIALTFSDRELDPALIKFIGTQAVKKEMQNNVTTLGFALVERLAKADGTLKAGPPFRTPPIPYDYLEIRARLVELKQETDRILWPMGITRIDTNALDQSLLDKLPA